MAAALPIPFPPRKLWTRDECAQMTGIFDVERYELIEGELVEKVSKNQPHILAAQACFGWLLAIFGLSRVFQELPVDLHPNDNPTTELHPDVVLLNRSLRDIGSRPGPSEIALIIEVSDSTLNFDLTRKRDLYARGAVVDYWVVDVNGRRIIVHREPVDCVYRSIVTYAEDSQIACLASPTHQIVVRDLLSL